MDSKTALRGMNTSAGPLASSTANAARPRFRSIQPLSLTRRGQYGPLDVQNTKTCLQTSQTGLGHQQGQGWSLNVAERPLHGLHGRSTLPRGPCVCVVLAVLSGWRISVCDDSYIQLRSLVLSSPCPGVRAEGFGAGSRWSPILPS